MDDSTKRPLNEGQGSGQLEPKPISQTEPAQPTDAGAPTNAVPPQGAAPQQPVAGNVPPAGAQPVAGKVSPGQMPPQNAAYGQQAPPPGAMPQGAVPPPPGAVPPGAVPPGAVPPGAVPPYTQPSYGYAPPQPSSGKAIGALVCGILAILFCWTILPGIALGIAAIVLASKAVKESGKDGKATGGKITGIVGIAFSVLTLVAAIALGALLVSVIDEAARDGSISYSYSRDYSDHHRYLDSSDATAEEQAVMDAMTPQIERLVAKDETMLQVLARDLDEQMRDATDDYAGPTGVSLTDAGIDPTTVANWLLDGMTWTLDGASVQTVDNEAEAYLSLERRDVHEFSQTVMASVNEQVRAAGGAVTNEQVATAVNAAVTNAMARCESRMTDNWSVDFDSVGGVWQIEVDWYDTLVDDCFD